MVIPIKKIILEFNLEKDLSSSFKKYMSHRKAPVIPQKLVKSIQPKTTPEGPDTTGIYNPNGSIKGSYNVAELGESLK